jgi:hypothetical protein
MSLNLAAAVLLILVAVMLIPAVAMSILAVVKNIVFLLKGPGYIPVLFIRSYLKIIFWPNLGVEASF